MNRRLTFVFTILIGFYLSQSLVAWTLKENNPGISTLEEITLGGAKQWILMRGEDVTNPVLLFLHGGPGFPEMPYTHIDSPLLEKHFVVVNWDQRGAGKSYNADIPEDTLHIDQIVSDTHELIRLLKERFSKEKIFLIGHSWGSVLGLYTAYRHPEDLHAYIGMGQVVNMKEGETISYLYTIEKATKAKDEKAIEMLKGIGPPPYKEGFQGLSIQRMLLAKYGGSYHNISILDLERYRNTSPFYTEADKNSIMQAFVHVIHLLWDELMEVNFFTEVPEVQISVYFFTGRYDHQAPFEILERYFLVLKAPYKEIVWFENSGHAPNLDEPDIYQKKLINVVLKNTPEK